MEDEILVSAQDGAPASPQPNAPVESAEIVVTAPSTGLAQDIAEWNRFDYGEEQLDLQEKIDDLDDDRARLETRQRAAEARVAQASTALEQARQAGATERQIARLQQALEQREGSRDLTRLAEREQEIATIQQRVDRLGAIHDRLIAHVVGNPTFTVPGGGQIRGPTASFANAEDAARDAIALSFAVTSLTRDPFERAGLIVRNGDGTFTYPGLIVGTVPSRSFRVGRVTVDAGTPFVRFRPTSNTAGYFHIHPNNSRLNRRENESFSDNDTTAYREAFAERPERNYQAYLGGSDGSFSVLRNGVTTAVELRPARYFTVPRTR